MSLKNGHYPFQIRRAPSSNSEARSPLAAPRTARTSFDPICRSRLLTRKLPSFRPMYMFKMFLRKDARFIRLR